MPEFHETRIGRQYYEHTLPSLVKALQDVAEALKVDEEKRYAEFKKAMIKLFSESNSHE